MDSFRTIVVNKYREDYDVYIGRGTIWGNPFSHKQNTKAAIVVNSREDAIERFERYLLGRPELLMEIESLQGKILGCTCKPLSCHGDVICNVLDKYTKSCTESDESAYW